MSKLITGIFPTADSADRAVRDLAEAGFRPEDISVLMPETHEGHEFKIEKHTKASQGAATGAAIGGTVGAVAMGIAAIATVAVPGLAFVAAGPIIAALTGLGAGAAAGGVTGALVGLGVPEHEAKLYNERLGKGGVLVGVHAEDDRTHDAERILTTAGADNV
jgi:hypothetical protein